MAFTIEWVSMDVQQQKRRSDFSGRRLMSQLLGN